MPAFLLCAVLAVFSAGTQPPVSMNHLHVAPLEEGNARAAVADSSATTLQSYVDACGAPHVFDVFAGENKTLAAVSLDPASYEVAMHFEVALPGEELFQQVLTEPDGYTWLGAVQSVDALGMRLRLDLSGLQDGETAWIVDPNGPAMFGPYTQEDQVPGGLFTNLVGGDTAMVMIRSPYDTPPNLAVLEVAHFYRWLDDSNSFKALLTCHVNAVCEEDATIQSISTGVGLILVPVGFSTRLCTGTLINNGDTEALEPYFLTANHCVGTATEAQQSEILWDYLADDCSSLDGPTLSSVPRSHGEQLLSTNAEYDLTLMELDEVPAGARGRTYAGYTTEQIQLSTQGVALHHPAGELMRISYGAVRDTSVSTVAGGVLRTSQFQVLWNIGVTEGGSSGSAFLRNNDYLVTGVLSNGSDHSCGDTSNNFDNFGSLRAFFPQVKDWLSGANPPSPDTTPTTGSCPASKAFETEPAILDSLRAFRDDVMAQSNLGRQLVALYYEYAPGLAEWVDHSNSNRAAFQMAALPFAGIGQTLR